MSSDELVILLESHGIKPTVNRLIVAKALSEGRRPLSLAELESKIETVDKSGIFRSLTLFRDSHLVHAIDSAEGTRYELCHSHDSHSDEDIHVHFYCESCHRTFCLEEISIPPVDLPEGYEAQTANYLVKGLCPECASSNSSSSKAHR